MSIDVQMSPTVTQHDDTPLIEVQDLHVWFELKKWGFSHVGWVRAVDNVNFKLQHGEAIAIVGESGCGKSSLMKTLLLLNRPHKGRVLFEGEDISKLKGKKLKWYRSQVGYVQQDPYGALPPFMPIHRILEEPLVINGIKNKKERDERIRNAMEEVALTPVEDFLNKYPHMLSGGQQQRVVIARAMILEPKLLVADEPVSMLDASVRVEILRLLRKLQEQHNLSVMYITHDLSTVRFFSERIFVMYAGKLVEQTHIENLLNNPLPPYTKALLTGPSVPDAANASHLKHVPPGEPPSLVNPPTGCRFHPRCEHFMSGKCDVQEPPHLEPLPGHLVNCWLYEDGRTSYPELEHIEETVAAA
jgi:peptide/nickel transport system ATP-binding protein